VRVARSGTPIGRVRVGDGRAEQDRALFARYLDQRDPVDREMLVERFLPLARQLARRYQRPDEPFDDLFQVACLGLINAIDRFDLDRGLAFSSYAVPTILGEIKRYFRDRTWSVRVPRDLQDLALKVDRAVSELDLELRRKPTVAEIGAKVGADEEDVLEALEASGAYRATSLQTPWGADDDSGDTLGDVIGREECGFALAEDRATIDHIMRVITPREREVLRLRFAGDLTQAEIGERIGISQMQVSRIIRQALGRLRSYATAHEGAHAHPSGSVRVLSRRASQSAFAR
jgi:RNA polymerase sigma-B factor